jgi:hypothetical protein
MRIVHLGIVVVSAFAACPAHAGLHCSTEPIAELPSQWRGYLSDLRTLRSIAVKPTPNLPASTYRKHYQDDVARLRDAAKHRRLSAEEQADLGANLIRLGEIEQALDVLRAAQREHPQRFAIVANLGTAWQLYGDLEQAADCLRQAVTLAPGKLQKAESLHLKLVRERLRHRGDEQRLDRLFDVQFVGETGKWEPGKLSAAERKKLPSDAVALMQQLCLWLPADARLLWQLGELANAHGDVKIANELFEVCVAQFALGAPDVRERRALLREAATALEKGPPGPTAGKAEHAGHAPAIAPRSKRPLAARRFDTATLQPVTKTGANPLPWGLLLDTNVDQAFRVTFPKYLMELKDLQVTLSGFMQPLSDDLEHAAFMLIEYPVGCWYCEVPDINGIVLVELPDGKSAQYTRNLIKVTGKLSLNASDPENFLYTIKAAKVVEAD